MIQEIKMTTMSFNLESIGFRMILPKEKSLKACLDFFHKSIKKESIFENKLKEIISKQIDYSHNWMFKKHLGNGLEDLLDILRTYYDFSIDKEIVKSYWIDSVNEDIFTDKYDIERLCNNNDWLYEFQNENKIITYDLEGNIQKVFLFKVEDCYTITGRWYAIKQNYYIKYPMCD